MMAKSTRYSLVRMDLRDVTLARHRKGLFFFLEKFERRQDAYRLVQSQPTKQPGSLGLKCAIDSKALKNENIRFRRTQLYDRIPRAIWNLFLGLQTLAT